MSSRHAIVIGSTAVCVIAISLYLSSRADLDGQASPSLSKPAAEGKAEPERAGSRSALIVPEPASPRSIALAEEARIAQDLQSLHDMILELERKSAVPQFNRVAGESVREGILVPELTVSQLQPLYDRLSAKAGSYTPGSPAAERFRMEAGDLLRKMGQRPAKYVERVSDTKTGTQNFKVIRMAPGTTLQVGSEGKVSVNGRHSVSLNSDGSSVKHLFGE